jgi:CheY-like chemotaxis protein
MGAQPAVLVVDDFADQRAICKLALESNGYLVKVAEGGEAALESLRAGDPVDVVLADIMMPGVSGLDLARRVREEYPDLSIVLMTAYPDVLQDALEEGFLPLVKPFTAAQLRETVFDALALRRSDGKGGTAD